MPDGVDSTSLSSRSYVDSISQILPALIGTGVSSKFGQPLKQLNENCNYTKHIDLQQTATIIEISDILTQKYSIVTNTFLFIED